MSDNNSYVDDEGKFDTKSLLEDSFLKNLGSSIKNMPQIPRIPDRSIKIDTATVANYNTEKMLTELYESRDGMIEAFSEIGLTASSEVLVNSINKIGSCIRALGGDANHFDPLSSVSGLQSPRMAKNAERVIENTKDSYQLGKIEEANIGDDGKTITMAFSGKQGKVSYKSVGTITANEAWMGNEAVDYIYSPGAGRMSVKVPKGNQWIDNSDDYKISWELYEGEETSLNKEAGNAPNNTELKEEVKKPSPNNIDEDIGDFPIEEK